jgi:hypothetical protein
MCAEKPADVHDGTEAFAVGGFTETLPKRAGEEHGGIQAAIFLPGKFLQRAKMTSLKVGPLNAIWRVEPLWDKPELSFKFDYIAAVNFVNVRSNYNLGFIDLHLRLRFRQRMKRLALK